MCLSSQCIFPSYVYVVLLDFFPLRCVIKTQREQRLQIIHSLQTVIVKLHVHCTLYIVHIHSVTLHHKQLDKHNNHISDAKMKKAGTVNSEANLHLSFACADATAIMTKIVAINQFVFILDLLNCSPLFIQLKFSNLLLLIHVDYTANENRR